MKKTKTYDRQTAQFMAVVGQNMPDLSSETMQGWIENPAGLNRVLGSVLCPAKKKKTFEKWLTVKLGTGPRNADDFFRTFSDRGLKIESYTKDLLNKKAFIVADKEKEVDLVNVATFELGFKKFTSRFEIYKRAKELGLELCPPEVGPQLALQYKSQYQGEWIIIGMEPILSSEGTSNIFSVRCDGNHIMLCSYGASSDESWDPEQQWVFALPRK